MGLMKNENIGSITVLYSEQKTGLAPRFSLFNSMKPEMFLHDQKLYQV